MIIPLSIQQNVVVRQTLTNPFPYKVAIAEAFVSMARFGNPTGYVYFAVKNLSSSTDYGTGIIPMDDIPEIKPDFVAVPITFSAEIPSSQIISIEMSVPALNDVDMLNFVGIFANNDPESKGFYTLGECESYDGVNWLRPYGQRCNMVSKFKFNRRASSVLRKACLDNIDCAYRPKDTEVGDLVEQEFGTTSAMGALDAHFLATRTPLYQPEFLIQKARPAIELNEDGRTTFSMSLAMSCVHAEATHANGHKTSIDGYSWENGTTTFVLGDL